MILLVFFWYIVAIITSIRSVFPLFPLSIRKINTLRYETLFVMLSISVYENVYEIDYDGGIIIITT